MAGPYKEARPCSDPVAPPPHILSLDLGFPRETTMTGVRRGAGGRLVEVVLRGGCLPLLRTFELEASPLEAGSSIPLPVGSDRCCTAVVVVVVAIVLCWPRLYYRCTGCHRGTLAGA